MDGDTAATGTIAGAAGVLIGVFLKWLRDMVKDWREDSRKECDQENAAISKGYELAIAKMDARIAALELANEKLQNHHTECQKEVARLQSELNALNLKFATLSKGHS